MKRVIKYQSDSGILFDTKKQALEEDKRFRRDLENCGKCIYVYQPPAKVFSANGIYRQVWE